MDYKYISIKFLLLVIFIQAFVEFTVNCTPVRGNRTRSGKNTAKDKQLEFPGNDVEPRRPEEGEGEGEEPFQPNEPPEDPFQPRLPKEPRNPGFISRVLSFVRDIIGGRRRWWSTDGKRPTDDGNDDRNDRDDGDGGIWSSIRRNVANFLDGLIKTFGFSTPSSAPDPNFPYNKPERQKRV